MAKILLVDDDTLLVRMYQKKLQNDGFIVAIADDGVTALKKVPEFKPDLIVLDIMMPKMNGLQVLTKLKEQKTTEKIPVILLTIRDSVEDQVKGYQAQTTYYLNKPYSTDLLLAYIRASQKLPK